MTRPTLFKKILLAMLLLALVPLVVSSLILAFDLSKVRERLATEISATADRQASESLRLHAEQVAETVGNYLEECEADLLLVASLPNTPQILKHFYDTRRGEIWTRRQTATGVQSTRSWLPRYRTLTLIDRDGQETFSISDSRILPKAALKNVANSADTEFKTEEYFRQTRLLPRGGIYVSHLTGFHITKDDQLAGAADPEQAVSGKEYRGVVRFATPLFSQEGQFAGMVVLSLDHRHLMEFTQHINPGKNSQTVFPSYQSGNYAFMFDDEGWIITHPKYWDIRGVDREGRQIPPYTSSSSKEDVDQGRIPFNLYYAGFIHPNYPKVAEQASRRQSGYVDVTNIGGARKVMAFAPILYATGDYRKHGIFGAITIGFQVDQFHEMARTGVTLLNQQLQEHLKNSILILAGTIILVLLSAWLVSRGITDPVALLTERARSLASGAVDRRVEVTSRDELGELASTFNIMADELEERKNSLLKTLDELRASRREIMDERNFKESVLESISSAILTFSPAGTLTSINGTGRRLLGDNIPLGADYATAFAQCAEMAERLAQVLRKEKGYGREPYVREDNGHTRYFEVGFFPIGADAEQGTTVTMRDETEKERLREEMTRLDRLVSLGKLAAGIAHEVRNPLTGVSLLLDDLHDRPGIDADSQAMMGRALAEIERVEKLITSLLTYSTPPKTEFRTSDLCLVIQDTLLLLRRQCERQRVKLVQTECRLPLFTFDAEKIKQALLNLITNALDALPEGGTITVSATRDGNLVIMQVNDTGAGIAEDDLPLIFEPFFSRKGAGTGLGLSITQRIVEEHRGRIDVTSTLGQGTTFSIALPLQQH
jgi:signal transduction histidine kinase